MKPNFIFKRHIKSRMKNVSIFVRGGCAAFIVLSLSVAHFAQAAPPRPVLPDITLPTLDGKQWSLKQYRGSIVIINFWATWCEPCRTEMPMLAKLSTEFEDKRVKVVGIAVDHEANPMVLKFVRDHKIPFPILLPAADSPLGKVDKMPTTLLIDQQGRLAEKYFGIVPEENLRADIEKLAKETNEAGKLSQ